MLQQKNWMECPTCSVYQHSGHVDGNMKLYRFKSAGRKRRDCYYGESFIASSDKVDAHVQEVYETTKRNKEPVEKSMCGDTSWKAARNIGKKKKNLDETGLEILGCRHSIAQQAVNMYQGEIYGYAHYLQKIYLGMKNVDFIWYDVICQYWPWLTNPALSVMHAKAHSWPCQILWGGRWQDLACATTGEEVEQVNSHFSRLGNSTKHMLPEGRDELLTEHALSWNRWKITCMPVILSKRYIKAKKDATSARSKISQLIIDLNIDNYCPGEWIEEIRSVAKEEQLNRKKRCVLSDNEETFLANSVYVGNNSDNPLVSSAIKMFPTYYKKITSSDITVMIGNLQQKHAENWSGVLLEGEQSLTAKIEQTMERNMESSYYELAQLVANMNKLADSSKQRRRLRTKITSCKANLISACAAYNIFKPSACINADDVQSGRFAWITEDAVEKGPPIRTKKKVCEQENDCRRHEEEISLIEKEMRNFLVYYKDGVLPKLKENAVALTNMLSNDSNSDHHANTARDQGKYCTDSVEETVLQGRLALCKRGIDFAMQQLQFGVEVFTKTFTNNFSDVLEFISNFDVDESDDDESSEEECSDNEDPRNNDETLQEHEHSTHYSSLVINPEKDKNGCFVWKLPFEASQGNVGRQNGSSACTIIALMIGHAVLTKCVSLPADAPLPAIWITLLVQCMKSGNGIYKHLKPSLPSQFLSVAEACTVLAGTIEFLAEEPLPIRLVDSYIEMITLKLKI